MNILGENIKTGEIGKSGGFARKLLICKIKKPPGLGTCLGGPGDLYLRHFLCGIIHMVDITRPLSEDQQVAADKLTPRELMFCNLILTKDEHHMSQGECYAAAGYSSKNANVRSINATVLTRKTNLWAYLRLMRDEACERSGLTLEYLDAQTKQILDGFASDVMDSFASVMHSIDDETGEPITNHYIKLRCAIDDLPQEVQACIHSIKMTKHGPEVKMYSRLEALKLAYQRNAALVERKEHTGANGGPIEYSELSDEELEAKILLLASKK